MKKVSILAIAAIFTLGLASCKKEYTCTCTGTNSNILIPASTKLPKAKKKDAKTTCSNLEAGYKLFEPTTSCSID